MNSTVPDCRTASGKRDDCAVRREYPLVRMNGHAPPSVVDGLHHMFEADVHAFGERGWHLAVAAGKSPVDGFPGFRPCWNSKGKRPTA